MTALLTDNLPLLAGAPNGIKKLRELILELAVRGKLVPQDPSDEPASELLKRIAEEKARLVAEGKIKNPKPLTRLKEEDQSDDLPEGWALSRLGEVVNICTGKLDANAAVPGGEYPFFTCSQTPSSIATYSFDTAAVLLAGNGDFNLKKFQGRFDAYQRTYVIEPVIWSLDFCFISVSAEIERITENNRGSAIPYLKLGDITNPVIWMPPLAEQHRIVAKVDELMALCDRLETQQADTESAHAELVQALLGSLTQAADAGDFAASWQRLAEHFHTLFTTESSIDALKQTLLQLAVMGKLVPQDPNDEPADELLEKIASEIAQLYSEGKIRKPKSIDVVSTEDAAFEAPQGWKWLRLSRITRQLGDGLHGTPIYSKDGEYYFVNGNNLKEGKIAIKPETKTVSEAEYIKHKKPLDGQSILVSINGTIGNVAFYNSEKIVLGKSACYLNLASGVSKDFVRLLIEGPGFMKYALKSATGTTIKNLGLKAMNDYPIALPPLAEQHRIVAKVDQLMALCDQLKTRLTQARQLNEQLATALVEKAVA